MGLKTADFDFPLPPDCIAQYPAKPRDSARLLVVAAGFEDQFFISFFVGVLIDQVSQVPRRNKNSKASHWIFTL